MTVPGKALLNVGVIGVGRMGSVHARHLANAITGARLSAIADLKPEVREAFTRELDLDPSRVFEGGGLWSSWAYQAPSGGAQRKAERRSDSWRRAWLIGSGPAADADAFELPQAFRSGQPGESDIRPGAGHLDALRKPLTLPGVSSRPCAAAMSSRPTNSSGLRARV